MPILDAVAGGEGKFRERPICMAVCCHVVPAMRFALKAVEVYILLLVVAGGKAYATTPAGTSDRDL